MLTYKKAGVDIDKASLLKERIALLARKSATPQVLKQIGGFGSLFELPKDLYKNPVLVSSSDGVGTKLKIAVLVVSGLFTLAMVAFYAKGELGWPAFLILILVMFGLFLTPALVERKIRCNRMRRLARTLSGSGTGDATSSHCHW